jgi:hypothetical protein
VTFLAASFRPALVLLIVGVLPAEAQDAVRPGTILGGVAEDRLRIAQLSGRAPPAAFLFRSFSSLNPPRSARDGGPTAEPIVADLRLIRNSTHPFSLNQGSLWAGRGWSASLAAGFRLSVGPLALTVAPQVVHMQNRDVQVIPSPADDRSTFSSPWYVGDRPMDLPLRFGNESLSIFDLGQSGFVLYTDRADLGLSTESQWWGPGLRNAIVLSGNAPGIPHFFARTARPLDVSIGTIEGKWMIGGLSESTFFDTASANDIRSLSAAILTFSPAFEPGLTLGVARSAMAAIDGAGEVPGRALDVVTKWGTTADTDQLTAFFLRWIFPADGLETWVEWARLEAPTSFRDFLAAPHRSQGYTLGLQWARPIGDSGILRLQGEVTNLEASAAFRGDTVPTFYVGRNVEHGYTHRGRVIGAAIGPGSSSQWIATDYLGGSWQAGLFAGRIRWETDTYYLQPTGFSFASHDVSIFGGVRGAGNLLGAAVSMDFTAGHRYNYLFQNHLGGWGANTRFDRSNFTLDVRVSPGGWRGSLRDDRPPPR